MNVALYGRPARWAMTERGTTSLRRTPDTIAIGASAMRWDGDTLTITIDEVTVPLPSRLRGTIRVKPRALTAHGFALDSKQRHRWHPLAPSSDVTIEFQNPALRWRGTGYFDTNEGDEPLEAAFTSWTWSRFARADHARIVYDTVESDGATRALSLCVDEGGLITPAPALAYAPLASGLWGVERSAPTDPGHRPRLVKALEDAPFYTRSVIRSRIDGDDAIGMHESLSLPRLTANWVRMLLPFRMPRRRRFIGLAP